MKKKHVWYYSNKHHITGARLNIYLILWVFIIVVAVYLLIRFAAISFSYEMGQADPSYQDAFYYYVSNQAIEAGSSLVSYQVEGKEASVFPLSAFTRRFAIAAYVKDKGYLVSKAEEKIVENQTQDILGIYQFPKNTISDVYSLSNGAYFNEQQALYAGNTSLTESEQQLAVGSLEGEVTEEREDKQSDQDAIEASNPGNIINYTRDQLKDVSFLVRNFYIVDPATKVTDGLFDAEQLLGKDMTLKQGNEAPQILIYHTHSQETYIDSRVGEKADTVVGVGSYLAQILEDEYGYHVLHDDSCYDIIDGKLNRNKAYNMAKDGVQKLLDENPSIEVVIDLHRDGAEKKRSTMINGNETAQIMLFNGLSRDQNGPIAYLENPYVQDNLAMSLQLQLKAIEQYPGLFYKNYLNCYRYNMQLRPKCILMELGTNRNTLQSAKNAMEPFAKILDLVLRGK